jgi:glycosyltransferase involved in cell wall biosynthesis
MGDFVKAGKANIESAFPIASVDVVIPFHRQDQYLNQAISAAISSTGVMVRIIAVNDSGQNVDKSALGLRASDLLVTSNFKGYLGAMSAGFQNCESDFIAFLDSDDVQDADRIYQQVWRMIQESADISSCNISKFVNNQPLSAVKPLLGPLPKFLDARFSLVLGAHGADSTLILRKHWVTENFESHSKFPFQLADYGWLMLLLMKNAKYVHVDYVNYYYRLHKNQISRSASLSNEWKALYPAWIKFLQFLAIDTKGLTEDVGLLIAFPSSLNKIDRSKVRALRELKRNLIPEIESRNLRSWLLLELQIASREVIGRRGLTPKTILVLPYLIFSLFKKKARFKVLRRNAK